MTEVADYIRNVNQWNFLKLSINWNSGHNGSYINQRKYNAMQFSSNKKDNSVNWYLFVKRIFFQCFKYKGRSIKGKKKYSSNSLFLILCLKYMQGLIFMY